MTGKRKIVAILTAALFMTGLTGCAENQIPDLSGDEIQAVGEYVALTMMKYDMNHRSRLMDLSVLEEADSVPGDSAGTQEPEEEEPSGMAPVDDTPVVDSEGKEETAVSSYSLEEVMGLPEGLEVTFTGQEMHDSYPEGEDFFSLNASEGKKLMVLHFSIANTGEQEQSLDMLHSETVFQITVNETYSRRALTTMLLDDMATYVGTVPAGGNVDTVLVIELESGMAENVSSASMNVKNEDKACTCLLF